MARNLPLFIAFRLLFNARFYYPVFAVIQLDYGLSMAQFAVLNAVWAVSIVLLEVPSGALADRIGRKKMVVGAAVLMVLEMAVIAVVPLGNGSLVFWAWVVNRILSGAAEASASGADEALAYDSISPAERTTLWPKVLTRMMMLSSVAFIVAMLIGSAVYDVNLLNRGLSWIGSDLTLEAETVMRFPIYLTLATGLGAVLVSLLMVEPEGTSRETAASLWGGIWEVGRWILGSPVVYIIILAVLVNDCVVRLFLTSSSEYYRLIGIPAVWYGVVGAVFAGMGLFTPRIAEWLVRHRSIQSNFLIVSGVTLLGFIGIALAIPVWGVVMVAFFGVSFGLLNYFTSHYLNAEVDSEHRATVLSFKGLALNVGFGTISIFYGGILRSLRSSEAVEASQATPFRQSLYWLPGIFIGLFLILLVVYFLRRPFQEVDGKRVD